MKAFLWHTEHRIRHHLRADSVDDARKRIAMTHGEEVAKRAVIRRLTLRDREPVSMTAA